GKQDLAMRRRKLLDGSFLFRGAEDNRDVPSAVRRVLREPPNERLTPGGDTLPFDLRHLRPPLRAAVPAHHHPLVAHSLPDDSHLGSMRMMAVSLPPRSTWRKISFGFFCAAFSNAA